MSQTKAQKRTKKPMASFIMHQGKALVISLFFFLPLFADSSIAQRAITTLPKSGTHFFDNLRRELNIDVTMSHFALNTEQTWGWWGNAFPFLLRKPEEFSGKTVILVRDLRDVMPSAVLWLVQCSQDVLDNAAVHDDLSLQLAREYLDASYDEQLLKTIRCEGMAAGFMTFIVSSCNLVAELLKKPKETIFIVRFEDVIGARAGGYLEDPARFELLAKMFLFLGFERSLQDIAEATTRAFGHSRSYNQVEKKVGRWKDQYNDRHKQAFEQYWGSYNQLFGYQ